MKWKIKIMHRPANQLCQGDFWNLLNCFWNIMGHWNRFSYSAYRVSKIIADISKTNSKLLSFQCFVLWKVWTANSWLGIEFEIEETYDYIAHQMRKESVSNFYRNKAFKFPIDKMLFVRIVWAKNRSKMSIPNASFGRPTPRAKNDKQNSKINRTIFNSIFWHLQILCVNNYVTLPFEFVITGHE